MPFEVVGGDAASDRLAKGLAKDISSDLSRLRDIDIVTISATDAKDADARGVAKAMHVRYLVSGSIQREGDAARVTAQLVDGGTGATLWSRRWDRLIADIFAIQNEVADGVIATLGDRGQLVNLTAAAARHKRPSDLEAYDLYAMGIVAKHKGGTKENLEEALKYEDAAVAKDPQFALAKVQKGWTIMFLAWDFQRDNLQSLEEALKLAKEAVEIDLNDAQAHILLGTVLLFSGDNAGARVEIDRALQLNPSSADILDVSAGAMSYFGNPEQGAAMCDRAFRLNAPARLVCRKLCAELFLYHAIPDFVNMSKRWIAYMPKGIWANNFAWLAAAQSQLGAAEDAAATIAEWKRVYPDLGAEVVLGYPETFDRPIEADKFLAALQKANAPICVASDKLNSLPDMKRLALCDAQRAKEATR